MVTIFADHRESRSSVFRALDLMGADLRIQELEVGDFILSDDVGIERKTGEDALESFIGSAEKGKIFRQCLDLVRAYRKPLLILECDLSDLFVRNIHPGCVWGMLRSIIWNGCPIEFTYTAEGTAKRLYELAKTEQEGSKKSFSPHGNKKKRTPSEQLVFSVSSLPDIGNNTSLHLLEHFKTVQGIVNAEPEQLEEVKLVGAETAKKIHGFFRREFRKEELHP